MEADETLAASVRELADEAAQGPVSLLHLEWIGARAAAYARAIFSIRLAERFAGKCQTARKRQRQLARSARAWRSVGEAHRRASVQCLAIDCSGRCRRLHDQQSEQKAAARQVDVVSAMHALKEAVDRQSEMQQAFIFVLSLPQSGRDKLNLAKPRALYEMQALEREHRR